MTITATAHNPVNLLPSPALVGLPRSGSRETVGARIALGLLSALRAAGVDADAAARAAGIEPDHLAEDDRVPLSRYYDLWEAAVSLTGDSALPLAAARATPLIAIELLGFACSTQRDLGTGLDVLSELAPLWTSGERFDFNWSPLPCLAITLPEHRARGGEHVALFLAAKAVADARAMSGRRDLAPLLVRLPRPLRPDGATLEAYFGCPVAYGCARVEIVLRRETAELPLPKADPAMASFFTAQAQRAVAELAPTDRLVERVVATIREALDRGDPSMPVVARELGCSPRTLRRQLSRRGTGFRELLDEVRRELACVYLRRTDLPLAQVTELLGFSEQSNFQRAFKRWTDTTPDRYRRTEA